MDKHTYSSDVRWSEYASPEVVGAVFLAFVLFAIISYVIGAFLLGRLFKKAGAHQWAAWVPVYNVWKLLELGNQQGFWVLFGLVPFLWIIPTIFLYIAAYHIGKKLGKEGWFVLLAIFMPVVWLIWLGFDESKWPKEKLPHPPKKTTTKKT